MFYLFLDNHGILKHYDKDCAELAAFSAEKQVIEAMGLLAVATHHDKSVALSSQQITVHFMGVLIQPFLSHPPHK